MSVADVVAEFPELVRPLRRAEYDQLVDLGVFEDQPIELLEGVLVEMSPEGPYHSDVISYLNNHLVRRLPEEVSVRVGHPYAASEVSEPEPDLALVVAKRRIGGDHPSAAHLLIEVSDSSRRKDLGPKARVYAANGVPVYWVIDLRARMVHVHTDPTPTGYSMVTLHQPPESLDVFGVPVDLAVLFPEDAPT